MKAKSKESQKIFAAFAGVCALAVLHILSAVFTNTRSEHLLSITKLASHLQLYGHTGRADPERLPPACDYFFGREKFNDTSCNITLALKYSAEATLAGGCVPHKSYERGCVQQTTLMSHTLFTALNFDDEVAMRRFVLLLRAWMLTQDLRRSRFVVWAIQILPDVESTTNRPWLRQFDPYISLRQFDYDAQAAVTPLSLSQHFSSWAMFSNSTANMPALQSDVFRNIILFNYGGMWLDTDSVPLRDLWDITAGVGLQFIPKFKSFIANGHVMYVNCPKSDLARRRLEHITMFPKDHEKAWPRQPSAGGPHWVFNDALSEYVQATQALRYNLSRDGELIDPSRVPQDAWSDVEVPFPISWFDNWWVCNKLTERNNSDFRKTTACNGTYIWHRLNKHTKGQREWGPNSGGDQFWDEIYGGSVYDHTAIRRDGWPLEPVILTGGITC